MTCNREIVHLREMEEHDWKAVHRYASQEKVSQFQPWGPNDEEESRTYVKQAIEDAHKEPRSRFVFAVMVKERNGLIGAGEFHISDFTNKVGEIGYVINPDYWGMGFATETAKQLIGFGFEQLNLHRIYATCDPRNIASSKVLKKAGMIEEGRLREDILLKDGWRDSLIYSILEQEWTRESIT